MNLLHLVDELDGMLISGDFMGAFEKFFADEVVTLTGPSDITYNKAEKRERLQGFLNNVYPNHATRHSVGTGENTTYSEFTFEFITLSGERRVFHEILRRIWEDGKVKEEKYFMAEPSPILPEQNDSGSTAAIVAEEKTFAIRESAEVGIEIPDGNITGLSHHIFVESQGVIRDIAVELDVTHPFIGDLQVILKSPSGRQVLLHNREGGSAQNIHHTYGMEKLHEYSGEGTEGHWTLEIRDFATRDKGVLNRWALNMNYDATVSENTTSIAEDAGLEDMGAIAVSLVDMQAGEESTSFVTMPIIEGAADNLKEIEGIGPKIEEVLNQAGITTYRQIANMPTAEIKAILEAAGSRYRMHDPSSWGKQAELIIEGKWDELKAFQRNLESV